MQADVTSASDDEQGFPGKQDMERPSARIHRCQEAADRYDAMAASGMPYNSVWMRLKEGGSSADEEQIPWLPVGSLSVPHSSQVSDAPFDSEEIILQVAHRLYEHRR